MRVVCLGVLCACQHSHFSSQIGVPNVVFTSEGKTMLDLVNFAKESFDYATDAAFYLRHELNLVTECAPRTCSVA